MSSALKEASQSVGPGKTEFGVHRHGNGPESLWVLCIALFFTLLFVLMVNQRILNRLQGNRLVVVQRGCVQIEFSDDGKTWYYADRPDNPFRLVRLHNLCSGLTVRIDEQEEE